MSINERIAQAKGYQIASRNPDGGFWAVWDGDGKMTAQSWATREQAIKAGIPDWEHDLNAAILLLKEFRAALQWCDYPSNQYWQVRVDIDHYLHPCGRISKDEPAMIIAEAYCLQMGLDIE